MIEHSHIMLIDDNEGDLFLMNEVMERLGVKNVTICKDGKQAIDYFSNGHGSPELVFLDINLPKKNGHDVLRFIRNEILLKDTPIVIFSTSSSLRDINKSYDNDASGFLTKPEDFDNFEKLVFNTVQFWLKYSVQLKRSQTNGVRFSMKGNSE